jgi:hypothetical protein
MANMGGWSSEKNTEEEAQKAENARLCKIYTYKIGSYKKTMRGDDLSHATLKNYERLQKKYCETTDHNQTN